MRRFIQLITCSISGLLLTCSVSVCPSFATDQTILESIELHPALEGDTIEVRSNQRFDFVTYTLSNPDRLIIDPVESQITASFAPGSLPEGGIVQAVLLAAPAGEADSSQIDYLSFSLSEPVEHLWVPTEQGVRIQVRSKERFVLPPTGSEQTLLALPPTAQEVQPSFVPIPKPAPSLRSNVWNLDQSLEFGLGRYRPITISRKEVELAQLKVREARRALYPAATLKSSWTEGTASDVDFTEYQMGIQVEHPLYYSGRLMETYRQSLVNLQVANKRKSKVAADYSLELAEAYFQFIGAKVSQAAQRNLVSETNEFDRKTQARFDEGLLTRLEVLNVKSQVNQANFQRANAENDVILSRIKYLAKLSLTPEAIVEVPSEFPTIGTSSIELKEALELAAQHRPDIQINTLLVKFHEYEERISIAKGKLKVDLSGFVGASASAFETEDLDAGDDYFVGLKATRTWGKGNSANLSVTETKTSPRLGQTTRTDSTVYSAEFGILDQLQGFSEVKQAQVNLEKAKRDLAESKAAVFQEVQEAYVGFNKSKLQLEYARQKITFRTEQVKILEAQASLNEALPSQVLEAIMKLTEEKVGQAQALSAYHVALAKLNKAIGLPRHYE